MINIQSYINSYISKNNIEDISTLPGFLKKNTGALNAFLKNAKSSPWVKPVAAALAVSLGVIAYRAIGPNSELTNLFRLCDHWKQKATQGDAKSMNILHSMWDEGLCLSGKESTRDAFKTAFKKCQDWESKARNGDWHSMSELEQVWDRKDFLAENQDEASIREAYKTAIQRKCQIWKSDARKGYSRNMAALKGAWARKDCLTSDQDKLSIKNDYNTAMTQKCQDWELKARNGVWLCMNSLEEAWTREDCLNQDQSSIKDSYKIAILKNCKDWELEARNDGDWQSLNKLEKAWDKKDCLAEDQYKSSVRDAYYEAYRKKKMSNLGVRS